MMRRCDAGSESTPFEKTRSFFRENALLDLREDTLPERLIRDWRAVSPAGLQGAAGSRSPYITICWPGPFQALVCHWRLGCLSDAKVGLLNPRPQLLRSPDARRTSGNLTLARRVPKSRRQRPKEGERAGESSDERTNS